MNLRDSVINLYLTMINDPDGVCTPQSVQEEFELIIKGLGVKVRFNHDTFKFEVIKND